MILFSPVPPRNREDRDAAQLRFVLGRNVKRLRMEQKFNKKSFAALCGIGRPLLDEIEGGTSDIRLSYVQKVADALAVSPVDLLAEATLDTRDEQVKRKGGPESASPTRLSEAD